MLNFFTTYNASLPNMDTLVKKYLPLLHSDGNLKELFPAIVFNTVYRRNKNQQKQQDLLSLSLFPNRKNNNIISCKSNSIISLIVATSATIIWFFKTCLLVQLLICYVINQNIFV